MFPNPYPAASDAARHHAEIEAPNESVGIVIDDGEYVPLVNVHATPTEAFAISSEDEEKYAGQIKAVIHSHCLMPGEFDVQDGPLIGGVSSGDMQQQAAMGLPWGLVTVIDKTSHESVLWFGDDVPVAPLVGRPFVHGIYDCYSAIRDAYRSDEFGFVKERWDESSIVLPDFPRDFNWWEDRGADGNARIPENLYMNNFAAAGFKSIGRDEMEPGDVFLAQIGASVTNHGGIWLGENLIFHHLRRRLSRREAGSRWMEYTTSYLRYDPR